MTIARTAPFGAVTDDSGLGTDGTVANNVWLQGLHVGLHVDAHHYKRACDVSRAGCATVAAMSGESRHTRGRDRHVERQYHDFIEQGISDGC